MPFSSDGFFLPDVDYMQNYGATAEGTGGMRTAGSFGPENHGGEGTAAPAASHFIDPPSAQPSGTLAFLDEMFGPLHAWGASDEQQRTGEQQQPGLDLSSLPQLRTSSKPSAPPPGRRVNTAPSPQLSSA